MVKIRVPKTIKFRGLPPQAPSPQTRNLAEFIVKTKPKLVFSPDPPPKKKHPWVPKVEIHCKNNVIFKKIYYFLLKKIPK